MRQVIHFEILIGRAHATRAQNASPVGELSSIYTDAHRSGISLPPSRPSLPPPFPTGDYYVPSPCLLRNGYIGVGRPIYVYRVWYLTRQTDNLAPLRSYNDRYPRAQRVQQWCSARESPGVYRPICGFMPAVCMRRSHFAAIMIER